MKITNRLKTTIINSTLLLLILVMLLTGCTKKPNEDLTIPEESIIEVIEIDGTKYTLVKEKEDFVFYDEDKNITKELTDKHLEVLKKYKIDENIPSVEQQEVANPNVSIDTPEMVAEPPKEQGNTATKPVEPTQPTEPTKPKEPAKPSKKITYGEIEYIDTEIAFRYLEDEEDVNKANGTSGWLSNGVNGISRKEVRKVYVNGKYSHTETVKDSYVYKKPVDQQGWYGSKSMTDRQHRPDYVKEVIRLVNIERNKVGLPNFQLADENAQKKTSKRAEEIVVDYSHKSVGNNRIGAEAIYKNIGMKPKRAVEGWMKSEGHRSILLAGLKQIESEPNPIIHFAVGVYEEDGWFHYVLGVQPH